MRLRMIKGRIYICKSSEVNLHNVPIVSVLVSAELATFRSIHNRQMADIEVNLLNI